MYGLAWVFQQQNMLIERARNFNNRLLEEGIAIVEARIDADIKIDIHDSEQFLTYAKETGVVYESTVGTFGYKPYWVFHDGIAYSYYSTRYIGD
jgi:hypothetical protein